MRECLATRWVPEAVEAFVEQAMRLETCEPEEVRQLAAMLTNPDGTGRAGR